MIKIFNIDLLQIGDNSIWEEERLGVSIQGGIKELNFIPHNTKLSS